jgi:hypothetical protein
MIRTEAELVVRRIFVARPLICAKAADESLVVARLQLIVMLLGMSGHSASKMVAPRSLFFLPDLKARYAAARSSPIGRFLGTRENSKNGAPIRFSGKLRVWR